ncbi:MAG: DUF192 domain-containing protein [Rhodobacteraceae bacterium]|nr:DUF192 domain-containing protein [Paracoccaceae bacterium]
MKSLVVAAIWVASAGLAAAQCGETRVDLRGEWGAARFTVELADTHDTRSLGLMSRPSLASSAGMLFVYEEPQTVAFWMENTLIALDMIFLSADGVVQKIHENAVPLDRTLIPGGDDILAVLEINGGMSAMLGVTVGSQLRHPRLDQAGAAWPCEE